ncbi:MAG: hypothetical protein ABSF70_08105 [Terracidiphilus sp.]
MASYCARCGTELSPNELICKSCGAAAATGDAVAAFIPSTAPPEKSGSSALKVVLIVIAVVVGLGILGLGAIGFIGYRIAKNVHVDPNGGVTMSTPMGNITTTPDESISASDLGVAVYPGAQATHKGMRMEMPGASGVILEFLTSDSPDKVLAFYKNELGSGAVVVSLFGQSTARLQMSKQESVEVRISASSRLNDGKTKITITHMMKKGS